MENYFFERYLNKNLGRQKEFFKSLDFGKLFIEKMEKEENWETVDQRLQKTNATKQETIMPCLQTLQTIGTEFTFY